MGDSIITKRLIISGLTPSITAEDISHRLTSFGTVKAADGFGLPDGLGQPRKFGYVTLETTASKLAKCMNLLSGSTWKGAKLRFGEAKPDYRDRIALENAKAAEEPPKKKRKLFGGVYADDMSLVIPENAAQQPGWKVSSLGRVTKPVRMRPAHPLPDVQAEMSRSKAKQGSSKKQDEPVKKKKRTKEPDTRARRRTIDMTKWGSTHLKGVFLDLELPVGRKNAMNAALTMEDIGDTETGSESDADADEVAAAVEELSISPSPSVLPSKDAVSSPCPHPPHLSPPQQVLLKSNSAPSPVQITDIELEKVQNLRLLTSFFGGDGNEDDWIGRESFGSDIDVEELVKGDRILANEDLDFEVVPRNAQKVVHHSPEQEAVEKDEEMVEVDDMAVDPPAQAESTSRASASAPSKLKDLFAPQEAQGGFSLLGHLDLDLELEEDLAFLAEQPPQASAPQSTPYIAPAPVTLQTHSSQQPLVLNPKQALFFPLPLDSSSTLRARQKDVYDLAKEGGWYWRDPAVGFYKTENDEEIRKRWEESRGELTRDWKMRWKEAGKVRRRKKGTDGVDD